MMDRLDEQQAKQILFDAQCASYPNKNVPAILAPLYRYIEQIEAENAALRDMILHEKEARERDSVDTFNRTVDLMNTYRQLVAENEEWKKIANQEQTKWGEACAEVMKLEAEKTTLRADNAVLFTIIGRINNDPSVWKNVSSHPHPGESLLKELEQLRAVRDAAVAVIGFPGQTGSREAFWQALAQAKAGDK
jgi:hypothetical protein